MLGPAMLRGTFITAECDIGSTVVRRNPPCTPGCYSEIWAWHLIAHLVLYQTTDNHDRVWQAQLSLLLLALDEPTSTTQGEELQKAGKLSGGVLTPASAMGHVLLDRLMQHAGTTFNIESSSAKA